jgi:hypothetical protein
LEVKKNPQKRDLAKEADRPASQQQAWAIPSQVVEAQVQ